MVSNDADKDSCPCCSEPKPGAQPKKEAAKPTETGSITTSGFKFGGNPVPGSTVSNSGFKFGGNPVSGSNAPSSGFVCGPVKSTETTSKSSTDDKEYSKEFLAHLKV